MVADLDACDNGEDLHMNAVAGVISYLLQDSDLLGVNNRSKDVGALCRA